MNDPPRRGWRERVEAGLYRSHAVGCPSSADRRPGRRCSCPWQLAAPAVRPGSTRLVTFAGSALEARRERHRLLAAGRPSPPPSEVPAGGQATLDEFAAHYLRARSAVLAPATIYTTEESYRLRVSPALGELTLAAIDRERVEIWLGELVASASSRRMVTKSVEALRVILAAAVDWGRIQTNPAVGLRLPSRADEAEQAVERVLNTAQLALLLRTAPRPERAGIRPGPNATRTETLLRAAAEAGLRRGEVLGLRWPDVRLAERRLDVRRSVWQGREAGAERVEKSTKGRRSRPVAISPTFCERLAAWYAESVVAGGADARGFVWPARDGRPMAADTPGQTLERALRRAGLVDPDGRPLVSFHGLRHTAGSIMLAAGVPLIVVSRQLGHANPQITATVYAHLLGDWQLDQAAMAFEAQAAFRPTLRETLRERRRGAKSRMDSGVTRGMTTGS